MLESFVVHARAGRMVVAVDSTGFAYGQPSSYAKKTKLRRKLVKVSVCAYMGSQIICGIKVRHRCQNDSIDFAPLAERATGTGNISCVQADSWYDSD